MNRTGRVVLGLIALSLVVPSGGPRAATVSGLEEAAGEVELPTDEAPETVEGVTSPLAAAGEHPEAADTKVQPRPGAVPVAPFNPSLGSWWSSLTVPARVWVVLASLVAGWFLFDALVEDPQEQPASPM